MAYEQTEDYSPIKFKKLTDAAPENKADTEKDLVQKHMTEFNRRSMWRKPYEDLWAMIYRLYMTVGSNQKLPTRAKVMLPIVFQVVEAAISKFVAIIFGQPQFFDVMFRNKNTAQPSSVLEKIKILLTYQLDKAKFFLKFVDFAKQLLLYGTSYFYVYWKVKREWVVEKTPVRENITNSGFVIQENALRWETKRVYKVTERRPEIEVLPIEDVYPDPEARTPDDCNGIYVVTYVSMDDMKELSTGQFPVYKNFDQVEASKGVPEENSFRIDKRTIRGTGQPQSYKLDKNTVELITYWGKEDLDGDGIREEVCITIANRLVLVKADVNGFEHQKRPVIKSTLFPVPMEWYGVGLVEPIIPMVHELVTIRNQNIDMNNLIINRMWKVNVNSDIDLDTLFSGPNQIILTDDMDGVQALPQEAIPFSPIQMSEMIQRDIENATAPKSIQGSPEGGALGRTARGAQLIISQALEKFGMGAKLIEDGAIKEVLTMMHQLDAQFLDNDEVLASPVFYGEVFPQPPTPEEVRADVTIKMLGLSETVNAEAKINQLSAFFNTFKADPTLNVKEIEHTMWDLMSLQKPFAEITQPVVDAADVATTAINNPNVSGEGEAAIINQVARNGSAAPTAVPQ